MEVMNRKDEQLFEKLVRLARGNSRVVMAALSAAPRRKDSAVDLDAVVKLIVESREQVKAG